MGNQKLEEVFNFQKDNLYLNTFFRAVVFETIAFFLINLGNGVKNVEKKL